MQRHPLDIHPESGVRRHVTERLLRGRYGFAVSCYLRVNLCQLASRHVIAWTEGAVRVAVDSSMQRYTLDVHPERRVGGHICKRLLRGRYSLVVTGRVCHDLSR